jgi:DNA-binding GntR family transcriptional regulator
MTEPVRTVRRAVSRATSATDAKREADGWHQSDAALYAIRRAIVRCELPPGCTVSEAELESRFNLKRAAVRAALERLKAQDLVRPLHRRGYQVKPITLRDVSELFEVREVIETATVRLAVKRIDKAGLETLRQMASHGYEPGNRDTEDAFLEQNSEFHRVIATAAGNDRLMLMLNDVLDEMERLFHYGLAVRDRTFEWQHEHDELVTALERGDVEAAVAATRHQIAFSRTMVIDALVSSSSLRDVSITA